MQINEKLKLIRFVKGLNKKQFAESLCRLYWPQMHNQLHSLDCKTRKQKQGNELITMGNRQRRRYSEESLE